MRLTFPALITIALITFVKLILFAGLTTAIVAALANQLIALGNPRKQLRLSVRP